MITVNLLGKSYEIAPYKLGALREAAPHIDAMNAIDGALSTLEGMTEAASHMVKVVAIGLRKIDATMTAEYIEEHLGIDELPALGEAVRDLLAESGLTSSGEATALSAPAAAEGASETASSTSSPSS